MFSKKCLFSASRSTSEKPQKFSGCLQRNILLIRYFRLRRKQKSQPCDVDKEINSDVNIRCETYHHEVESLLAPFDKNLKMVLMDRDRDIPYLIWKCSNSNDANRNSIPCDNSSYPNTIQHLSSSRVKGFLFTSFGKNKKSLVFYT